MANILLEALRREVSTTLGQVDLSLSAVWALFVTQQVRGRAPFLSYVQYYTVWVVYYATLLVGAIALILYSLMSVLWQLVSGSGRRGGNDVPEMAMVPPDWAEWQGVVLRSMPTWEKRMLILSVPALFVLSLWLVYRL